MRSVGVALNIFQTSLRTRKPPKRRRRRSRSSLSKIIRRPKLVRSVARTSRSSTPRMRTRNATMEVSGTSATPLPRMAPTSTRSACRTRPWTRAWSSRSTRSSRRPLSRQIMWNPSQVHLSLSLFLYFSSFRIIETFEPVKIVKQSFDTVYMLFGARMLRKNVSFVSTYEKWTGSKCKNPSGWCKFECLHCLLLMED